MSTSKDYKQPTTTVMQNTQQNEILNKPNFKAADPQLTLLASTLIQPSNYTIPLEQQTSTQVYVSVASTQKYIKTSDQPYVAVVLQEHSQEPSTTQYGINSQRKSESDFICINRKDGYYIKKDCVQTFFVCFGGFFLILNINAINFRYCHKTRLPRQFGIWYFDYGLWISRKLQKIKVI